MGQANEDWLTRLEEEEETEELIVCDECSNYFRENDLTYAEGWYEIGDGDVWFCDDCADKVGLLTIR